MRVHLILGCLHLTQSIIAILLFISIPCADAHDSDADSAIEFSDSLNKMSSGACKASKQMPDQAESVNSDMAVNMYDQARRYYSGGDLTRCSKMSDACIELLTGRSSPHEIKLRGMCRLLRGKCLKTLGRPLLAENELTSGLQEICSVDGALDDSLCEFVCDQAELALERFYTGKAQKYLASLKHETWRGALLRGRCQALQFSYGNAETCLRRALLLVATDRVAADSSAFRIHRDLGKVLAGQLRFDEAVAHGQKAVDIACHSGLSPEEKRSALIALGITLYRKGDFQQSLLVLEKASSQGVKVSDELTLARGIVYQKLGRLQDARELLARRERTFGDVEKFVYVPRFQFLPVPPADASTDEALTALERVRLQHRLAPLLVAEGLKAYSENALQFARMESPIPLPLSEPAQLAGIPIYPCSAETSMYLFKCLDRLGIPTGVTSAEMHELMLVDEELKLRFRTERAIEMSTFSASPERDAFRQLIQIKPPCDYRKTSPARKPEAQSAQLSYSKAAVSQLLPSETRLKDLRSRASGSRCYPAHESTKEKLPLRDELGLDDGRLLYLSAWKDVLEGRYERGSTNLAKLLSAGELNHRREVRLHACVLSAYALACLGRFDRALEDYEPVLKSLREEPAIPLDTRLTLLEFAAYLNSQSDRPADAGRAVVDILRLGKTNASFDAGRFAAFSAAMEECIIGGEYKKAIELGGEYLTLIENSESLLPHASRRVGDPQFDWLLQSSATCRIRRAMAYDGLKDEKKSLDDLKSAYRIFEMLGDTKKSRSAFCYGLRETICCKSHGTLNDSDYFQVNRIHGTAGFHDLRQTIKVFLDLSDVPSRWSSKIENLSVDCFKQWARHLDVPELFEFVNYAKDADVVYIVHLNHSSAGEAGMTTWALSHERCNGFGNTESTDCRIDIYDDFLESSYPLMANRSLKYPSRERDLSRRECCALRHVALHEIGHLLGLKHSDSSCDVMYFSGYKSEISARDVCTLKKLYAGAPRAREAPP